MEEKSSKAKTGIDNSDIIVIGLTGPFGSGCSTFAKFFDDSLEQEKARISFIDFWRNFYIEYEKINERIRYFYKLLNDIEKKLIESNNSKIVEIELKFLKDRILKIIKDNNIFNFIKEKTRDYSKCFIERGVFINIKKRLFSELKVLLEQREAFNALKGNTSKLAEFIKEEIPSDIDINSEEIREYHHFRKITMSDIIVFKTFRHLDTAPGKIKKIKYNNKYKGKYGLLDEYLEKARRYENEVNRIVQDSGFKSLSGYYEKFQEVLSVSNSELGGLKKAMIKMVEVIKKAKDEFYKMDKYRELMQDFGDNIRRCGDPYEYKTPYKEKNLDKKSKDRLVNEKEDTKYELVRDAKNIIELLVKDGDHKVFIIDALRNPFEVLYLRERFINFYLISIYAPHDIRLERIKRAKEEVKGRKFNKKDEKEFDEYFVKCDERDSGSGVKEEKLFYEQHVTSCGRLADIAINNYVAEDLGRKNDKRKGNKTSLSKQFLKKVEEYSFKDFERKIIRHLALIIDKGCTKPNDDECSMNQAYAMAMKSNCISRQVGAVVVDKDGYIIGAGWNDVGEGHISCGLIEIRDIKANIPMIKEYFSKMKDLKDIDLSKIEDELQKLFGYKQPPLDDHCICFKDLISIKELERKIRNKDISDIKNHMKDIYQKKLEYCRALHAEENAILQGARRGGMGLKGAKIYTTTYPCPLCAKKIVQVGIEEVIFDDPYPTDLSEIFLEEGKRKVRLRHFEGVKPLGYFRLFKPDYDQKDWQYFETSNLVERFRYTKDGKD